MAEQLIANLAEPFSPDKYTDDYRANLMRIIRAKLKGKKADLEPMQEAEPADEQVIDLMSRLRESLEQGKKQPAGGKRARSGAVRASRKSAAARERTPNSRRSA